MTPPGKRFIQGFVLCYLLGGLCASAAFHRAMPAMSPLGLTYVGATWMPAMFCTATDICNTVPANAKWAFNHA